jgi:hypothetical protein
MSIVVGGTNTAQGSRGLLYVDDFYLHPVSVQGGL